jgi:membrane fusion protein (multidrug efflux system)
MADDSLSGPGREANEEQPSSAPDREVSALPAEPLRRRSRLKRNWKLIAPIVLVVVAAAVVWWWYLGRFETTDDAQVDVHLYPVSSRVSGYVLKVNVQDNQYVPQGTVLVEIDPRDYELAVEEARAELANAEAKAEALKITVPITSANTTSQLESTASDVEGASAGIIAAEKELTAAHAQLEQAEAVDVRAQQDLERYKALVRKQEVSTQIYDQAQATAKASAASVAAARANEAAAQQSVQQAKSRLAQTQASHRYAETGPQQVSSTQARVRAAIADVQQKRASLDQAELNLEYTKIVAPVSGEVNKTVVVGMNVEPGQQLLTVVPLDQVWVTANFKETQLKHMHAGETAEIDVDANGRTCQGHVDSVAGATGPVFSLLPPENATGNYVKIVQRIPVKIVLEPGENKDHQLRPGMNVVAHVRVR